MLDLVTVVVAGLLVLMIVVHLVELHLGVDRTSSAERRRRSLRRELDRYSG